MIQFKLISVLVCSLGFQFALAQDQDTSKAYGAKVFMMADTSLIEGYLYQLKETSVSISNSSLLASPTMTIREVDVKDIQRMEFQKKGGLGKRMLIGAIAGAAIGGIIGYASGGSNGQIISFSPGETALMLGIPLGVAGALVYGYAGAKIRIPIHGSSEIYYKKNKDLKKYSLLK